MSSISNFPSSRYMDYDYDNECIFGFDADEEDTNTFNMIFHLANNSMIDSKNLSPLRLPFELIGDIYWRKKKTKKQCSKSSPKTPKHKRKKIQIPITPISPVSTQKNIQQRTPSPISPQSPHQYNDNNNNNNNNNNDNNKQYGTDRFDKISTDRRLSLCSSDAVSKMLDTIKRSDVFNGKLYEANGTEIISNSYKWGFIMHETSQMIVGLTNGDIKGQQQMEIFVDTESNAIKQLFAAGRPKEGCVLEMSYDKFNGYMIIKNITPDTKDNGKQILCFTNIDPQKRYKLTILLSKPSTITIY